MKEKLTNEITINNHGNWITQTIINDIFMYGIIFKLFFLSSTIPHANDNDNRFHVDATENG
jgi:hypothetical protein